MTLFLFFYLELWQLFFEHEGKAKQHEEILVLTLLSHWTTPESSVPDSLFWGKITLYYSKTPDSCFFCYLHLKVFRLDTHDKGTRPGVDKFKQAYNLVTEKEQKDETFKNTCHSRWPMPSAIWVAFKGHSSAGETHRALRFLTAGVYPDPSVPVTGWFSNI